MILDVVLWRKCIFEPGQGGLHREASVERRRRCCRARNCCASVGLKPKWRKLDGNAGPEPGRAGLTSYSADAPPAPARGRAPKPDEPDAAEGGRPRIEAWERVVTRAHHGRHAVQTARNPSADKRCASGWSPPEPRACPITSS